MLTCIECCLNTVISTTLNYSIGCDISLTMWHIQPKDMNDTLCVRAKCHTFEPKKVVTVFGFYKLHFKQLYYKSTTDVLTCSDFVVSVFTNIHFLKTIFTVAVSFVGKYTVAHFWLMETGIILTHSSIILSLLFGCLHVFALALWKVLCFILKSDNPLGCLEKKTHPFRVLLIIMCLWGQKLLTVFDEHLGNTPFYHFFGRLQHM